MGVITLQALALAQHRLHQPHQQIGPPRGRHRPQGGIAQNRRSGPGAQVLGESSPVEMTTFGTFAHGGITSLRGPGRGQPGQGSGATEREAMSQVAFLMTNLRRPWCRGPAAMLASWKPSTPWRARPAPPTTTATSGSSATPDLVAGPGWATTSSVPWARRTGPAARPWSRGPYHGARSSRTAQRGVSPSRPGSATSRPSARTPGSLPYRASRKVQVLLHRRHPAHAVLESATPAPGPDRPRACRAPRRTPATSGSTSHARRAGRPAPLPTERARRPA